MKLKRELDSGLMIFGVLVGLTIGGVVTLFTTPKSGFVFRRQFANDSGQSSRPAVEAAVASDPVAESMAEGKAAARRRLAELGQN